MDESVPFGSTAYWVCCAAMLFSRSMDLLSTWIATPNLELEGNPIAKRLGFKLGILLSLTMSFLFALWPMIAIIVSTTSLLVAARNFQNAWVMRCMGEAQYRCWYVEQFTSAGLSLYLGCLVGQTLLTGIIGVALVYFSNTLVPFSIGLGIIAYAITVLFYTLLSIWRIRRAYI